MDPRTQATFIPKKPLNASSENRGLGFFSLIALIIFLASLAAAAGVFAYKFTLKKSIANAAEDLARQEKALDPEFINFIVKLNNRIEAAKVLLGKHIAVSSVFETLSRSTLQSVQFQNFVFNSVPVAGKDMITVNMRGVARDYTSLAAQSQEIGKNSKIKEPLFSNFTLNEEGRVSFTLSAIIDPGLLSYRERIQGRAIPASLNGGTGATSSQSTATTTNRAQQ